MAVKMIMAVLAGLALCSAKRTKAQVKQVNERCDTCRKASSKFFEAFDELKDKIEFAGKSKGWAKDNEKFLGKYDMSEALLHACLEKVCQRHERECNTLMEDAEEIVEDWFNSKPEQMDADALSQHLCVDKLEACCPAHHYGQSCKPCKGLKLEPEMSVCSTHGTCSGDGYRTGNGKCRCEDNRAGDICQHCAKGHYPLPDKDSVVTCEACDTACADECSGPGPSSCTACAAGYTEEGGTCQDIDECAAETGTGPCTDPNVYCDNTPGSYMCNSCDVSCADGCSGPTATNCVTCAQGFVKDEELGCVDVDECAQGHDGCLADQYCSNTPGSVTCEACSPACDQGCSGPAATDCVACKQGWEAATVGGCQDVDECQQGVCKAGENCDNTEGSYVCSCPVNKEVSPDGTCAFPPEQEALLAAANFQPSNASLVPLAPEQDTTPFSMPVGASKSNIAIVTRALTTDQQAQLGTAPTIARVEVVEPCCGDTFQVAVLEVTSTSVTMAVQRTDSGVGWDQELNLRWCGLVEDAKRDEL
eukprot:m.160222 g.160222  ORF g.160222 m.160222 type:complete len:533 (+) comp16497_c0_seq1:155-1753(+)